MEVEGREPKLLPGMPYAQGKPELKDGSQGRHPANLTRDYSKSKGYP